LSDLPPDAEPDLSQERRGERLDSWKEIALYLKRDVATVRRWEKRESLPVHRHLHEKLGSVFAYASELEAWSEGRGGLSSVAAAATVSASQSSRRGLVLLVAAGAPLIGLALILGLWTLEQDVPPPEPLRISADLGAAAPLAPFNVQFGDAAAISPDGAVLAFIAQEDDRDPQLYVRRLNQLHAEPLLGTNNALGPFFSPDGQWVGFFAGGKLKKIAVTGGAAVTLADALSSRGGAWSDDDTIVFSPDQTTGTHLLRISSAGGTAEPLTSLAEGEVIQVWPQVLPGSKAVLYTSSGTTGAYNDADLVVHVLPHGPRKVVQRGGYHGRYLSSGHLVYIHDGTLFAAPGARRCEIEFDHGRRTIRRVGKRHTRLPAGRSDRRRHTRSLDESRWDDTAATDGADELVHSEFLARWSTARLGDPWCIIGYLCLRLGAGHADAVNIRSRT
jgi:WD40-like Beta Propeller Repeat